MHTTGEWKYEKNGNSFYVTALGYYDVAVVRNSGNQDNEANARLIASAPQLLEALELARVEIINRLDDIGIQFPEQNETVCRIDFAIAAAKGQ